MMEKERTNLWMRKKHETIEENNNKIKNFRSRKRTKRYKNRKKNLQFYA